MNSDDHIVPDTFGELLENYQTAMYHYHHERRANSTVGTQVFGREVRRFEAAIGGLVDQAQD